MLTDEQTAEFLRTPVADVAAIVAHYVKESCALDPASAAQALITAMYSALPAKEDGYPPRLVKFADLKKEIGELPPALIPGFLPAKKLICLSGAAKQGKSLVGLELLHAISAGRKLMDRFPVDNPGPVAYFGFEDGGDEIESRLSQRGVTDLDDLYICWRSFDMATPAGLEMFKRLISGMPKPPSLIVIDTAREAFKLKDWNDSSLVYAAISPIRKWAHKNCTVILITHNDKDNFSTGVNKISDLSAIVSCCDSFMTLENQTVLYNGDLRWDCALGETIFIADRGMKSTKYVLQMATSKEGIKRNYE